MKLTACSCKEAISGKTVLVLVVFEGSLTAMFPLGKH